MAHPGLRSRKRHNSSFSIYHSYFLTMTNVITTHRLTKYYGGRPVVNQLELRVPQGTVYGLLGRNGAGKSTTIKMLLGMVHPDYGRGELFGEDSAELRPETRARIAYLAEGHPLYRWMSVGQAVRFTRAFYPRWNQRSWSRFSTTSSFRRSGRSAGSRTASGRKSPWPWPWRPIRSC